MQLSQMLQTTNNRNKGLIIQLNGSSNSKTRHKVFHNSYKIYMQYLRIQEENLTVE